MNLNRAKNDHKIVTFQGFYYLFNFNLKAMTQKCLIDDYRLSAELSHTADGGDQLFLGLVYEACSESGILDLLRGIVSPGSSIM